MDSHRLDHELILRVRIGRNDIDYTVAWLPADLKDYENIYPILVQLRKLIAEQEDARE